MIGRGLAPLAILLFLAGPAAAQENLIPSCYARIPVGLKVPPPARETFVLIDQTTALDPALTQTLRANVARLVKPGTGFTIATFSAFRNGYYANVTASGTVEPPVPQSERNRISVPKLKQLDRCLREQPLLGVRVALAFIARAQKVSAASFDQSEIMASLRQLSQRVARSRARDKVVVVASDMLEHSSATSFYANKGLKTINPAAEIKKAAGLVGNFGNARVYVIGGGILPPQSKQAGRTIAALDALEAFWKAWFKQSRARLLGFGRPNLVTPIP